jgi:hypothetical protein
VCVFEGERERERRGEQRSAQKMTNMARSKSTQETLEREMVQSFHSTTTTTPYYELSISSFATNLLVGGPGVRYCQATLSVLINLLWLLFIEISSIEGKYKKIDLSYHHSPKVIVILRDGDV